jgi:hypothetical protein
VVLPEIGRWPPPLCLIRRSRFVGAVTFLCAKL